MRILHTADWHLTETLNGVDRHPDIIARLEEIAHYLDEYHVDIMVVAGDMFSQCTRMEDLEKAVADVNRVFKPFLQRGGTIVTISGNHDNEHFFMMLRTALDLAAPIDPTRPGPRPGGRLYIAGQPTVLELADKVGQSVQFVLLPYPTPRRYLRGEDTNFKSPADKYRRLHDRLLDTLGDIRRDNRIFKDYLHTVLVAHIHVRGGQIHTRYHLSERDDIIYEQSEIPTYWEYMAYGHIHKPQAIGGIPYARYAGSIERLNIGEKDDDKSVVLVEIGPQGRQGDPQCLQLSPTPFYRIEIQNPETEMLGLGDRYPDADRALVSYQVVYKPGVHNPNAISEELKKIFPRVYDPLIVPEGSLALADDIEAANLRDVPGTVESYLQERLIGHPDREDVLGLARKLLAALE